MAVLREAYCPVPRRVLSHPRIPYMDAKMESVSLARAVARVAELREFGMSDRAARLQAGVEYRRRGGKLSALDAALTQAGNIGTRGNIGAL